MRRRPSVAGLSTAAAIAAQLVVTRVAFDADETRAYLFGHPITGVCALRAATGLPCPLCGATRAVALSLHGELARAFAIYPAAPIGCLGLAGAAAALAVWSLAVPAAGSPNARALVEWSRRGALGYAALCAVIWLADYVVRLGALLSSG